MPIVSRLRLEYIWLDGTTSQIKSGRSTVRSPQLRSKTRIMPFGGDLSVYRAQDMLQFAPAWTFDGSSTEQAVGDSSDCVLSPVRTCWDPFNSNAVLVLCEVLTPDMQPHPANTRRVAASLNHDCKKFDPWVGLEQEWTMMAANEVSEASRVWGQNLAPQGPYYCGVGEGRSLDRHLVDAHLDACLTAGLSVVGVNAEVMPGQWEFQIGGPQTDPLDGADQLWLARYLLHRITENTGVIASLDPKPVPGDWNGAGCHTNFSTAAMRASDGIAEIEKFCNALGDPKNVAIMQGALGVDFERRLTGEHETCSWEEYRWGVADRTASVRIPVHVARTGSGYLEDRRPNANCDPYRVVTALLTVLCALESDDE